MKFVSNDNLSVEISEQLATKMINYCRKSYPNECGGILIGFYSPDLCTAIITDITNQMGKHRTRFLRKDSGLARLLETKWGKGVYYVGEWHYHPNNFPTPSKTDLATMQNLASFEDLKCPEPILIIVGDFHLCWSFDVSIIIANQHITLNLADV